MISSPASKSTFFRYALPLVVFNLFVFFLSMFFTMHQLQRVTIVKVPNITNKSVESARSALRVRRLKMDIKEFRFDQRTEPNHVIAQIPRADEEVKSGSTVNLVVSRGSKTLTTPNLTGLSLSKSASLLSESGLNIGRITRYYTNEAQKDIVLDQIPSAGKNVNRGTNVHLLLAQGPRPLWLIMPNFHGWHQTDATNFIKSIGLELKEIKRSPDNSMPSGLIIEQTPKSGQRIQTGDPVGLIVSIQDSIQNASARLVNIEYNVPAGSSEYRLKLMIKDDSGMYEIYNAMEKPNSKISLRRRIYGNAGSLVIYLNGQIKEEREL